MSLLFCSDILQFHKSSQLLRTGPLKLCLKQINIHILYWLISKYDSRIHAKAIPGTTLKIDFLPEKYLILVGSPGIPFCVLSQEDLPGISEYSLIQILHSHSKPWLLSLGTICSASIITQNMCYSIRTQETDEKYIIP